MNVLRALANRFWNVSGEDTEAKSPRTLRELPVAKVVRLPTLRDGFERDGLVARHSERPAWPGEVRAPSEVMAQLRTDGFDRPRRAPVDLFGGVKPPPVQLTPAPTPTSAPGFLASLEDLALVG